MTESNQDQRESAPEPSFRFKVIATIAMILGGIGAWHIAHYLAINYFTIGDEPNLAEMKASVSGFVMACLGACFTLSVVCAWFHDRPLQRAKAAEEDGNVEEN